MMQIKKRIKKCHFCNCTGMDYLKASIQHLAQNNTEAAASNIVTYLSRVSADSVDAKKACGLAKVIVNKLHAEKKSRHALYVANCNLAVSTNAADKECMFTCTLQIGRCLRKIGRPLKAAIAYERAEKMAREMPQDSNLNMLAEVMMGKGLALSHCGKTHEAAAEKAFLVASDMYAYLKMKKKEATVLYNLALHYKQCKKNYTKADNLAEKACGLLMHRGATTAEVYFLRANIAADSGKKEKASKLLTTARMLAFKYYGPRHARTSVIARRLTY